MRWLVFLMMGTVQVGYGQAPLWGTLEAGPYAVGFKVETVYDYTRTNEDGERGRPVQIRWWYPAQSTTDGGSMTVEDYARFIAADPEATREDVAYALRYEISPMAYYALDLDAVKQAMEMPVAARAGAVEADGAFPLALWSVRIVTPLGQSVMSEYLASHGYVVASVASTEFPPRYPYEVQPENEKRRTRNTDVQDLEAALGHLRTNPHIDTDHMALMTWSYGGLAAILTQLRNPDIDAVVSLDATNWWTYDHLDTFVDYDPRRLNVPYLVVNIDRDDPRSIFGLIDYADAHKLTFHQLKHGTFNVHEDMLPVKLGLAPVPPWSLGTETAVLGYETISRYAHHFLNGVLRGERLAFEDLTSTLNLPEGFLTYQHKTGQPAPLSDAALVQAIQAGETPHVAADSMLTSIGSRLLDQARFDDAEVVLNYATTLYPETAEVYYVLAVAYLRQGEDEQAHVFLDRTLALDAQHAEARALKDALQDP